MDLIPAGVPVEDTRRTKRNTTQPTNTDSFNKGEYSSLKTYNKLEEIVPSSSRMELRHVKLIRRG